MRLGVMTTWGTSCGIATYSEELYTAVAEQGVPVVILAPSEPGSSMHKRSDLPVEMCWGRDVHGIHEHVLTAIRHYQIDVLHIQHEFGLFRLPEAFRQLLVAVRKEKVKVVITLHTVFAYPTQWPGFFQELRSLVDTVCVHTRQAQGVLVGLPGKASVKCIPHGSPYPQAVGNSDTGRELLRIPSRTPVDRRWALAFGFLGPNKNLVATLDAYAQVRSHGLVPALGLIICGEADGGYYSTTTLPATVSATGYGRDIVSYYKFVTPDQVADVVAACSFGVLNETMSKALSASGQVHLLAAHGLPLAVADVPKHTEAIQAGALPFQVDTACPARPTPSLVNALCAMTRSADLRRSVANGLAQMAQRTAWTRIAEVYKVLYQRLLGKESD